MRTVYTQAPFQRFDLGSHILQGTILRGSSLGQMTDPYLTKEERDKLLADISGAMARLKPIDDLFVWSQDNDPGLTTYLRQDATRFKALSNSIAPLYQTVKSVFDRLSETYAEAWYRPNPDELAAVKQWVTGVNEMAKILLARSATPTNLPPTSAPLPASVVRPTITLSPSTGGVASKDLLIAGGVAAGLGVLIYVITSLGKA